MIFGPVSRLTSIAALAALFVASASATLRAQNAATGSPPNIVLIMTDDMGYADLGSYGAPDIRTPHVDGLARDGVRLTSFYANAVLCTPTRAGLISGRYQQRFTLERALGSSGESLEQGLPATGYSLPQLLRNHGYATALVGKWHLGYKSEFSPRAHGFDYFFGHKSGYIDYYAHTNGSGEPDLWENETPIQREGYITDLITEQSVAFIEQNAGRPFFIDVSYNAPHWPYQVPDKPSVARDNAMHLGPHHEDTSTRAEYVAMMERVDSGVGDILGALDRLGLAENTLIIFTNDNGGEWLSNNGPLFHRKWTVWEGGIRVPTLMRWPGRIPPGQVSSQVGITMDLTRSIVAATQVTVPSEARLEGMDLLPVLTGQAPEVERTLFWRTTVGGRWQKAVRSGNWKLVVDGNHMMLFDLDADIGERMDLANRRQDVARRLFSRLEEWEQDVDAEAKLRSVDSVPPSP